MDKLEILDRLTRRVMIWLNRLSSNYRSQRKYKRANEASALRAEIGDALYSFRHYIEEEYNPKRLIMSYARLYCAFVRLLYDYGDIDMDFVDKAFDNVIGAATDIVLEIISKK